MRDHNYKNLSVEKNTDRMITVKRGKDRFNDEYSLALDENEVFYT
jgi:hypothetical protein